MVSSVLLSHAQDRLELLNTEALKRMPKQSRKFHDGARADQLAAIVRHVDVLHNAGVFDADIEALFGISELFNGTRAELAESGIEFDPEFPDVLLPDSEGAQ